MAFSFKHPYSFALGYEQPVAYFCMEYAIHQPLKLYAGGLGFLAGSHLRSAYDMKQNLVGIGILWKFGYYDQVRKPDQTMDVLFQEKVYGFLQPTEIRFSLTIGGKDITVTAYYLPPQLFCTAPLFLLSTDLPENDYLAKTICHKLYDPNPETRLAAAILLGIGGAKLLEYLNWEPAIYHLNESHALPLAFHLYGKWKDLVRLRSHLAFTNHTPEAGGNPQSSISLLEKIGFFGNVPVAEMRHITNVTGDVLDLTKACLLLAGKSNAVSKLHRKTLLTNWSKEVDLSGLISITNAQHFRYWSDIPLYDAILSGNINLLKERKKEGKDQLFDIVADQNGEILDRDVLTIVFAKRFTGYKRADLLLSKMDRFHQLVTSTKYPVQIIWAGKPYPMDYSAIGIFDKVVNLCKSYSNCSVLVGYELKLSKQLKLGADLWLNVPRFTHEASGTSGMSAAMNGAINCTIADGWAPEFVQDNRNSFVIPHADPELPDHQQDDADANALFDILENKVLPTYYDQPSQWLNIMQHSLQDIIPQFDSNRMAGEYYTQLYLPCLSENPQ